MPACSPSAGMEQSSTSDNRPPSITSRMKRVSSTVVSCPTAKPSTGDTARTVISPIRVSIAHGTATTLEARATYDDGMLEVFALVGLIAAGLAIAFVLILAGSIALDAVDRLVDRFRR